MLIWVMAVLLFLLFGALGYLKGAIRTIFPLIGLLVGVYLAVPLGPLVRPLVPLVGLANPVWSWLLPPALVFLLIAIVFIVIGFVVHGQVSRYYKYRADDHQRLSWERLNQRLGLSFGLVAGAGYTLLLGVVIYVLGYFTVQVSAGDSDPAVLRYLNKAREDLRSSGLEKTVAGLDPAPANYYLASDIIGLYYNNKLLDSRLAAYPPFLSLGERPEFQDVVNDVDYQNLLKSQASLSQILSNPKTQAILGSPDILQQFDQIDLKDLYDYLKTGESAKYQDQPLLGRWEVDGYLTLLEQKRRKTGMTSAEMRRIRQDVEMSRGFKLILAPDNTAKLKGPDVSQFLRQLADAAKATATAVASRAAATQAAAPVTPSGSSAMSQEMARRYGRAAAPPAPAPAPAPVAVAVAAPAAPPPPAPALAVIAAELAKLPVVVLAQGTWKEEGGKYVISLQGQSDLPQFVGTKKSSSVQASARDNRLFLTEGGQTMVMARY